MAIEDTRKRWGAVYAFGLKSLMIVLDMTIANVARGAIRSESRGATTSLRSCAASSARCPI